MTGINRGTYAINVTFDEYFGNRGVAIILTMWLRMTASSCNQLPKFSFLANQRELQFLFRANLSPIGFTF